MKILQILQNQFILICKISINYINIADTNVMKPKLFTTEL